MRSQHFVRFHPSREGLLEDFHGASVTDVTEDFSIRLIGYGGRGGWDTNWIARSNTIIHESTAKFKKSKPKLNPSFTRTQVGYAAHRIWARCIISSSQSYSCKYYEHGDCSWITLQQLILLSYCSFFCKGEHGALHANSKTHGLRGGCWWGGRTI